VLDWQSAKLVFQVFVRDMNSLRRLYMIGPVRFVFGILWLGIALATLGTLKNCTGVMMGYAVEANKNQMSLGQWNRQLLGRPQKKAHQESK
jgi:hypothetical protein